MWKLFPILIILIGMTYFASQLMKDIEDDTKFEVALDAATQEAVDKGEFTFPEDVIPVESKDCEGTQWIKQQSCSLNGSPMDGSEGSCGPGKEIWILDPDHSDFKPATGDGKCEPQERDCSVECPKPCEGDTWKDTGRCVRKEYDTAGNMTEIVLDGTEGKCGDGITDLELDTDAPDYVPAVGSGSCAFTKGGYCNVPCPEPEPPKCNNYTGWVENVGLGCVVSESSTRKVNCGETGVKMFYNVATNPTECPELVKWEVCQGDPCPVDCEGSWSAWSDPKSDEPCGVQPYKESIFTITKEAQFGGRACDATHGEKDRINSGRPKECCIEGGDWAPDPNMECRPDGTREYIQSYTENKVGGCPESAKRKTLACCYQKGDWTDVTECDSTGKKKQEQTTAGNCLSSVKTREVDCPYIGPWVKSGGCGTDGKQWYQRSVINSDETRTKSENCCYEGTWSGWGAWGDCDGSTRSRIRTRTPVNCPADTSTSETQTQTCNHCVGEFVEISRRDGCFLSTPKIYIDQEYRHITPATNGGNVCPFEHGLKLSKSIDGGNADCCFLFCD
jgi:hypothetical protein